MSPLPPSTPPFPYAPLCRSFEPSLDAPTNTPVHFMVESGEGWASGDKVSSRTFAAATDYFGMIFHGVTVTHVDALSHFFWNGKTYNGKPAHLVSTSLGATFGSVEERSEEHTSELQSRRNLVCRLLLEKKNTTTHHADITRSPTRDTSTRW